MISRFPKDWKITYVEPSFWLALAWSLFNKLPFKRNQTVQKNIEVISVVTIPFGDRFGFSRKCNDHIITNKMKKILKKKNVKRAILLFYKPRYSCVIGSLDESAICYDITDDIREFDASSKWLEGHIERLEKKSDMIFTSSEKILKRFQDAGRKNIFFIGNGVDVSHFEKVSRNDTITAKEVSNIRHPVIGYVGAVGEWFDFELLQKILREFPDCSVVLIGWAFSKQRNLLKQIKSKNLHFLGVKKYDELPRYIKAFDVCIIPFLSNRLTQSVNPNKFYEYLASGKPIVTTTLPELEKFRHVCNIAENHIEFIEYTRNAIKKDHDPAVALDIAKQNDWKDKAIKMTELIDRLDQQTK